jgi:hypothetical protein
VDSVVQLQCSTVVRMGVYPGSEIEQLLRARLDLLKFIQECWKHRAPLVLSLVPVQLRMISRFMDSLDSLAPNCLVQVARTFCKGL